MPCRDAKCAMRAMACGRQLSRFRQNRCAPRAVTGPPQAGQTDGGTMSLSGGSPSSSQTTPMISGITSLERRTQTSLPMRTRLRQMSP